MSISCNYYFVISTIVLSASALAHTVPVAAQNITFTGGTNTVSSTFGSVTTRNDAVADIITGSYIADIFALDTSTINVRHAYLGGYVDNITARDNSEVRFFSGTTEYYTGFGNSRMNMTGGFTDRVSVHENSTASISGGTVQLAYADDDAVVDVGGGYVNYMYGLKTGTTNITSGLLWAYFGYDSSRVNVSSRERTDMVMRSQGATANFIGADLSFIYLGYNSMDRVRFDYGDQFRITGVFRGVNQSHNFWIQNPDGFNGSPNGTPRQFTFNASVAVPESESLTLLLPALGVVAAVARRRK